ncbi:short-subunit dehydrogenase [Glaciihabitans tibetensis]|uniref:Short-subunit dehydrogenase n=1 Tax=Glaciihabitans tibetensis TaxID=1266600 RepID=A0A2T0VA20_9MICO|nr:SDR family NAD(P)-dependent oxidoreductase [Glaciihabitans tibetensis]PRY66994.1 short-subunit dehydrogenase [Glaciihabitans tibetensis]
MRKTIVITGASDGIGAAAARRLHANGHAVVVVGRSAEKTRHVATAIDSPYFVADFASLAAVRELAAALLDRFDTIDVLANNAGGVFGDRQKTEDGFEKTFQVNHLAPFLLTDLLLPTLIRSKATVIQTASIAARLYGKVDVSDLNNDRRFSANKAYGDSKLENILFTTELHRRYHPQGINAVAFHPGLVESSFASTTTSLSMKMLYANPFTKRMLVTSEQGADQLVWLSETMPGSAWQSGSYLEKRSIATRVNPQVRDEQLGRDLWAVSEKITR